MFRKRVGIPGVANKQHEWCSFCQRKPGEEGCTQVGTKREIRLSRMTRPTQIVINHEDKIEDKVKDKVKDKEEDKVKDKVEDKVEDKDEDKVEDKVEDTRMP